jgi:hypothetical protein
MLQHLQAEANGDMVETLHDWELKEAFRLDQMRREAVDRKRQIREQIKELKQTQKGRRRKRPRNATGAAETVIGLGVFVSRPETALLMTLIERIDTDKTIFTADFADNGDF